jgi:hypothetical protein
MNVRKLFSKDLHDIDWEVEYNLGRSEAMGTIVSSVMVRVFLCSHPLPNRLYWEYQQRRISGIVYSLIRNP